METFLVQRFEWLRFTCHKDINRQIKKSHVFLLTGNFTWYFTGQLCTSRCSFVPMGRSFTSWRGGGSFTPVAQLYILGAPLYLGHSFIPWGQLYTLGTAIHLGHSCIPWEQLYTLGAALYLGGSFVPGTQLCTWGAAFWEEASGRLDVSMTILHVYDLCVDHVTDRNVPSGCLTYTRVAGLLTLQVTERPRCVIVTNYSNCVVKLSCKTYDVGD